MQSLHLPEGQVANLGYNNIPGDDQPGDYREDGVEFVPMEWIQSISDANLQPNERAIYNEASTKRYMQYRNGQWETVPKDRLDYVLENKAYIDMPNQTFFTFLNPRDIYFGITINYRL